MTATAVCLVLICCGMVTQSRGGGLPPPATSPNPVSLFEKSVACIKHEGWQGNHPFYPKQDTNQRTSHNSINRLRACETGVSLPLQRIHVSSKFGKRKDPFTKRERFHNGIDLQARMGEKVYAMLPGKIIAVGRDQSRGCHISIRHGRYTIVYCHLSAILVKKGQEIFPGETVGLAGSTGCSTGPHLHLALYKGCYSLNPQIMLDYIMEVFKVCGF